LHKVVAKPSGMTGNRQLVALFRACGSTGLDRQVCIFCRIHKREKRRLGASEFARRPVIDTLFRHEKGV